MMRGLAWLALGGLWLAAAGTAHAATESECSQKMGETQALEKNLRGPGARKKFATYVGRARQAQKQKDWDRCVKELATALEKGPPPKP